MLKKFCDFLAGLPMTIVAGVFLIADLIPHLGEELGFVGYSLPFHASWVTVFISGIPLLYLAIYRIIHNRGISKISSALLISVAMLAAIYIGDLFAAGEVAFIMAIGAILEDMTTDRAKRGLKKLISLSPTVGRRLKDGKEETVPVDELRVGDILRVLPGETIPTDGAVVAGESSVDQSVMTGESLPIDKAVGDSVFCGTQNRFGSIDIKVSRLGEDSSLSKLIRLVKEAESKKAPMARIADRWASFLVPIALLIAVACYFITGSIERAVTVLVVFCPCALVLATPTAIMAAIGQATKHGVIIKSGEALEKMGKVDTVAFDKTGTLTEGKLELCDFILTSDTDEATALRLIASAEAKSEHPFGKALMQYASEKQIALSESEAFCMFMGKGVFAEVEGKRIFCGNTKLLSDNGVEIPDAVCEKASTLRAQGKAAIIASLDGECIAVIAFSDVLRAESAEVIARLSEMKLSTVLLTGDNAKTADFFAAKAGISTVRSELLPEHKTEAISALQAEGKLVCMVGDGVNDAPSLKTADVGIAMGDMGSDIAVEAADIALMSDDLSQLPYLKRLSNATVNTVRLSISLSMLINIAAVTLSVLGLLTPTTGALVHNAGSCFVVLIAALLYDRKF